MSLSLELSKRQLQQKLPELELLITAVDAQLLLQGEHLRDANPEDSWRKAVIQKIVEQFKRQKNIYISCCVLLKELLPTLQTREAVVQFATTFNQLHNQGKNLHNYIERLQSSLEPSENTLNGRRIQVDELVRSLE